MGLVRCMWRRLNWLGLHKFSCHLRYIHRWRMRLRDSPERVWRKMGRLSWRVQR